MKKTLTLIFAAVSCCLSALAATMPEVSTADAPKWYVIKYLEGGCALESRDNGAEVKTAALMGTDAQLWRFEGDNSTGYTITSKTGRKLYLNSVAKSQMFLSSTTASNNTKFAISASTVSGYTDSFVISPQSDKGLYMNQFGGAGEGKSLGLWSPVDKNCPLVFVSESEIEAQARLAKLPLIPMPTEIQILSGTAKLSAFNTIAYADDANRELVEFNAELLGKAADKSLQVKKSTAAEAGTVTLILDSSIDGEDAYTMTMNAEASVVIKASKTHGLFNGLQTLRQLFYDARFNNDGEVALIEVNDKPRFGYRGFMLDIARHYFDKQEVKKILDVMAMYKISKFHWHLTDDQGWRIEIPEYPKLIEVGTIRNGSFTKDSPRFNDDTEYGRGMYYTLDDLKEIVDYAAKLHIDIMPEIDLPGHMVAAIASYPKDFSCNPEQPIEGSVYSVRVNSGVSKDVLNVSKPEVMKFLKCVLSHMAEIFPYPVMHIGGDECPTLAWQKRVDANDTSFKNWMAENNLATVNDIQPWLVNELGKWLKSEYGKDVVCWNELTTHWNRDLETQPIIMCYSDYGKNAMKAATDLGMRTIYTGCWPFYLDMYQTYAGSHGQLSAHRFDDPYSGGYGNNTLQAVYTATPCSSIGGKEDLCMGVGANLWTETCNNNQEAEHQYFPRMLALAEVGWLPENQKNWGSFRTRVQTHFKVLDEFGVNYAKYDYDEPVLSDYEKSVKEAERLLSETKPGTVCYPSTDAYNALSAALKSSTPEKASQLTAAITEFKKAPLIQPEEGKTYRIISASVVWGRDYKGSAMYLTTDRNNADNHNKFRFHYTKQVEPEELFEFVPSDNGMFVRTRLDARYLRLATLDQKASSVTTKPSTSTTKKQCTVRIDAASVASQAPAYYDYIPGVVTISLVDGYTTDGASSRRLNASNDGYIYAKSDAVTGGIGCWRIEEVKDFTTELKSLVTKCTISKILQEELVEPATEEVAKGYVSLETYEQYVAIYAAKVGRSFTPTLVTGIRETVGTTVAESGESYDLSGRRHTGNTVGIYIQNNTKIIKN